MVHDLSPFIIQFTETFGLRWYGMSYMMGFVFCYFFISWLAQKQRVGLTTEKVSDFITYGAIGALVGGRLGYCIFYDPDLFFQVKSTLPFWGVLAVNEGGMASHGGILGVIVACLLFAKKNSISPTYLFDLVAVSGPVGLFFGRIANFINGELVGRPAEPNFPFAVRFPTDIFSWPNYEFQRLKDLGPVVEKLNPLKDQIQLSSSLWYELLEKYKFDSQAREAVSTTLNQIVSQIQHGNEALKIAIGPILTPRHPSQLYAAALEGLLTFVILFFIWRKPRKQGFVGGCYVILYASFRIFQEQFRMPDLEIGFQLFGLTRGQWLSIAMLLIGIFITFYWSRTSSKYVNGWSSGHSVNINKRR